VFRSGVVWQYEVRVSSSLDLEVEGTFEGPVDKLQGDDAAAPFAREVALIDAYGRAAPVAPGNGGWPIRCPSKCRVSYRMPLRKAAQAGARADVAYLAGEMVVAPPSTWLLRPEYAAADARYRFHVTLAPGVAFSSGVRPVAAAPDTYEASVSSLDESAFSAFGALRSVPLEARGSFAVLAPGLALDDAAASRWLNGEVGAISAYFGRAPADRLMIAVAPGTSAVTRGETLTGGGPSVLVRVGTGVTSENLADDWVVAHELVHVTFPSLEYDDTWFMEGLASYVEPVARARRGLLSTERLWADFIDGMPQGLPTTGDTGLRGNHEWGRVYWGGTLFFLLADIELRRRTAGARSLDDALRAITDRAGGEAHWTMNEVLEVGDRATGTAVLHELYARLAEAPGTQDLAALWTSLGVERAHATTTFQDSAPLSWVRAAITRGSGTAG
jgi:hypothetical protein